MAQHSPQKPVRRANRKPRPQRAQEDCAAPELGVEVKRGADGSTDVQTSARGVHAVLALAAVLIMLTVVAGFVAMAAMMHLQHEAPAPRETHTLVDRSS
jgi:hypothetical protein